MGDVVRASEEQRISADVPIDGRTSKFWGKLELFWARLLKERDKAKIATLRKLTTMVLNPEPPQPFVS